MQERFSVALHGTARAWRQAVDRRLKFLGLSQAGWMTIAVAANASSPLSQSELADRLAVEGATMVAMVDRLAKAGLIIREPCATDRRVKRVVLTEAGRRLHGAVKQEAATVRSELLAGMDPGCIEAATRLLEAITRKIDKSA